MFDKKNIGSRSQMFKVSVSEGVVSVSNGQVSDSEAETPSLCNTTRGKIWHWHNNFPEVQVMSLPS